MSTYRHPVDRGNKWPLAYCSVCRLIVARSPMGFAARHKRVRYEIDAIWEWCPGSGQPVTK